MMKKFSVALFIVLTIVIGYYAFTVFSKRESDIIAPKKAIETPSEDKTDKPEYQENKSNNTPREEDTSSETPPATDDQTESNTAYTITPEDCTDECEGKTGEEFLYCQNVCGLSATSANDCDRLSGLKKDYCIKDTAVEKKDASLCEMISDTTIKKTCKNRILEDVLESM